MENNGDLLTFLGRWHPLLVHLPIGMLVMAFILALISRKKDQSGPQSAISITLLCGAAAAVLACATGYLLSMGGGYEQRTLALHQWLGIAVAAVSIVCWVLYRKPAFSTFRLPFLALMLILLCSAGHFGGTLTHGSGYLAESLPQGMRQFFGDQPEQLIIENVQEAQVYSVIIQPIFQQRCQSCHGGKKQEGQFALHSFEQLMEGGESGPAIAPGKADSSELYRRLVLPEGHEDRMPPKGRTPITTDQVKLIAWWINAGAPTDKKVSELSQPTEIQPILAALEGGAEDALPDIPPLDAGLAEQLTAKGIKLIPLATGKHQLAVTTINYPAFNDEDAKLIAGMPQHVIELRLGNTQITDAALQHIGQLTELRELHLQNTSIGDAGIKQLHSCKQLRYLNLVNTKVTDQGLQALTGVPALKTVYLYHTATTDHGRNTLAQARPKLQIDTGNYALPTLPTDTLVY